MQNYANYLARRGDLLRRAADSIAPRIPPSPLGCLDALRIGGRIGRIRRIGWIRKIARIGRIGGIDGIGRKSIRIDEKSMKINEHRWGLKNIDEIR